MDINFNILVSPNKDIIAAISHIAANACIASRVVRIPPIREDEHFEHAEAKIAITLFGGPVPTPEEIRARRHVPVEEWPEYERATVEMVQQVVSEFHAATGRDLAKDHLTLKDRALAYAIALDIASRATASLLPQRAAPGTRSRRCR